MEAKIYIKIRAVDRILFFLKKIVINCMSFFIFLAIFILLSCTLGGETAGTYLSMIARHIWLTFMFVTPIAFTLMQTLLAPTSYQIINSELIVKKMLATNRYRLANYSIELIPRTIQSELLTLLFGAKQCIVLMHGGEKIVIPCEIQSDFSFQRLKRVILENQRRLGERKITKYHKSNLDNVIFNSRANAMKFQDIRKNKKLSRNCLIFSILFLFVFSAALYVFPQMESFLYKSLILVFIILFGFMATISGLKLIYDDQIPEDALVSVQITERVLVFEMPHRIEILRTQSIQEIYATSLDAHEAKKMRSLTFVVDGSAEYVFNYTYGSQENSIVQGPYERLIEQLKRLFGYKLNFLDD